jgi:glyoxylase-like metal-dependent hydrolase (beta-lactamase superfamily II)
LYTPVRVIPGIRSGRPEELTPEVGFVHTTFVNFYLLDNASGGWVLVDTGLPGYGWRVRSGAKARYGPGSRPEAIVLTHGHWDHAGAALELSHYWQVPIYAHRLELPFLTGKSDYPPKDPTVGGALGFLARFMPSTGYDFGDRIHPLPADGSVPGLPGWHWFHTPGHTSGHVSLFRDADRVLIAGDALATVNQDSAVEILFRQTRRFCRAPAPFTVDWNAAYNSVQFLASLKPTVVAAGHGQPIADGDTARNLAIFASRFNVPRRGRYVRQPAVADETGVTVLPPPVPDPFGKAVAGAALAGLAGVAIGKALKRRRPS